MVQTIPGFRPASGVLAFLLDHTVTLITAILTALVLPRLASKVSAKVALIREEELFAIAKISVLWLIPAIASLCFHESCVGLWTSFWKPCSELPSPFDISSTSFTVHADGGLYPEEKRNGRTWEKLFHVLSHADVCALRRNRVYERCLHSVVERLTPVVAGSLLHQGLFMASVALIRGKRVKKKRFYVLAAMLLEVSMIPASSTPVLFLCLLLLAITTYANTLVLGTSARQPVRQDGPEAVMPRLSRFVSAICAGTLQLCTATAWIANRLGRNSLL